MEQGTRPQWNRNFGSGTKKPVKTFQDLEVYQQALEAAVFIVNFVAAAFYRQIKNKRIPAGAPTEIKSEIMKSLTDSALYLPHLIAAAHSWRFGSQKECLILLERAMLGCNKIVVYLDQARDICATGVEAEKFEELQKKYLFIRRKVLNLQRSWQKYMNMPQGEKFIKL